MSKTIREFYQGSGHMVRFGGVYGTKADADKALAEYREEYPGPYSTLARVEPAEEHIGLYFVTGMRYASCD